MRRTLLPLALCLLLAAPPLSAQETEVPLPRERPLPEAVEPAPADEADPADADAAEQAGAADAAPEVPPRDYQVACPALLQGQVVAETLPPIAEGQCRLASPLALTALTANGRQVPLSAPVVTDCGMATLLPDWVAEIDRHVAAREDTRIAEVLSGTAYACRNVNNARAGNLSFHAFGAAVDITGFVLEDGRRISVLEDWDDTAAGSRTIRFAHEAACARFTTVLGPEADALHRDHLHLDLGCHGRRCTARICE